MKPLEGITVLDFTQAYSGPYCAMNLGDYGARAVSYTHLDVYKRQVYACAVIYFRLNCKG